MEAFGPMTSSVNTVSPPPYWLNAFMCMTPFFHVFKNRKPQLRMHYMGKQAEGLDSENDEAA